MLPHGGHGRAVFVTGAGTDVGKTFVTCGLLRHLRANGGTVAALKPVVSGFDEEAPGVSDSADLLRALGRDVTPAALHDLSPWRFRAPLSPDIAASREGRTIDFESLVEHSRRAIAEASADVLAIEGVGGVCVPLDATHTVADWIDAVDLPVLLVCGTYLGSFSHALTTLHVLRSRGRNVAAVVVSESALAPISLDESLATLRRFSYGVPAIGVPRDATPGDTAFAAIAGTIVFTSPVARELRDAVT